MVRNKTERLIEPPPGLSPIENSDLDTYGTFMSDQAILPIQPHEFDSLPAGFEYEHEISEASNTIAFDMGVDARDLRRCVVCGRKMAGGPRPGVTRAHVIGRTEDELVGVVFCFY